MKTFHFLSGLPRSGSTLLASILNQNPTIFATATSPLLDLLYLNEVELRNNPSYIANPDQQLIINTSNAIINGCWKHVPQDIVLDKHRAWPRNIPIIKQLITPNPKVIVTARDIPAIIASFLSLVRQQPTNFVDQHLRKMNMSINDENRCDLLLNEYISDPWMAFKQGFENDTSLCIHIVEYDDLVEKPVETIKKIYNFLEIPEFNHDFNNIENKTKDDDLVAWGLDGLHTIRSTLGKTSKSPREILGAHLFNKYKNLNLEFWRS